jgi:hypothetical protein
MLFSSFGHRLLLIFGLFLLVVAVILAANLGLLGAEAQSWVTRAIDEIDKIYSVSKTEIDFAAWVIGAMGTLLGAAWTVHTGWHYAERSLPNRLNEYNARWKDSIETSRADTIPALNDVASIYAASPSAPSLRQRLMHRVLGFRNSVEVWEANVQRLEDEFRVLTSSKVRCRAELVTAHLTLGDQLMRSGHQSDRALDSLRRGLSANKTDLDALELLAKQLFAMGAGVDALSILDKMVATAAQRNDQLRHSRALRYQAEILSESSNPADWTKGRAKLESAISSLSGSHSVSFDQRTCELARAHDLLANIQITRERFTAAKTALSNAERLFSSLDSPCGREGLERASNTRKRLDDAKKDPDNPNVQD